MNCSECIGLYFVCGVEKPCTRVGACPYSDLLLYKYLVLVNKLSYSEFCKS